MRVRGKDAPEFVKPAPERVAELTVTGALPVEERVSDWVVAVLIPMLPKAMLVALIVRVGTEATNWMGNFTLAEPAEAVKVAVCAVETEAAAAVKVALAEPAGTAIEAGMVTAAMLLARVTAKPPAGAGVFSVTVQMSVPEPVMEALAQESPVRVAVPVPVRLIADGLPAELLTMEIWPVSAPAVAGSN